MAPRILVADDEPHIREVVRAYLEREGYEVLEAADGDSALELARTPGLDLLVLRPDQLRAAVANFMLLLGGA